MSSARSSSQSASTSSPDYSAHRRPGPFGTAAEWTPRPLRSGALRGDCRPWVGRLKRSSLAQLHLETSWQGSSRYSPEYDDEAVRFMLRWAGPVVHQLPGQRWDARQLGLEVSGRATATESQSSIGEPARLAALERENRGGRAGWITSSREKPRPREFGRPRLRGRLDRGAHDFTVRGVRAT